MTGILIAFEIVLLVPLFVATWRTSLTGLASQGILMAWIAFRHGTDLSMDTVVEILDLVVLRAVIAPVVLYRVLLRQKAPRRNDVIAPNLFSWVVALALVLMAFRLADILVPVDGEQQMLVAVSTSAVLLGFLVLATRSGPLSQMVGALRLENAIALFELGGESHHEIGIRIGQTLVFVFTVAYFRWYLLHMPETHATPQTQLEMFRSSYLTDPVAEHGTRVPSAPSVSPERTSL